MPREVFTAGQVLTAAELNVVSDQSVMVFAGTAARGSAIPSPTEGMVTYLQDADELQVYTTDWGGVGGGLILQVLSTTKVDAFTTTSTSFTDITGLSLSITPSSTSSKIFAILNINTSNSGNSADTFQLVRGATAIGNGTSGSLYNGFYSSNSFAIGASGNNLINVGFSYLDSPSTTSSTTYKIQCKAAAHTLKINNEGTGTNLGTSSSLTLLEVAG